MRIALFCHSLRSDWNNGNAHFLRGIVNELQRRGHEVRVFEPAGGWSVRNLVKDHSSAPIAAFRRIYPRLCPIVYDPESLDLDRALADIELVLVHEWNEPELVRRLGEYRQRRDDHVLLFHDTHHQAATNPRAFERFGLERFDGVLAFGESLRRLHLERGWTRSAWTWHEAADIRVFQPQPMLDEMGDVVWIGNWGDDEREQELRDFLLEPVRHLRLRARVHGVRYPERALRALEDAGIEYAGWVANIDVPDVFGAYRATVHVPRRPYVDSLPGIPTIRMFEAMACGIPLVTAAWDDAEGLFRADVDYLVARDTDEMTRHLRMLVTDASAAVEMGANARETILARHTCAQRVDQLLDIVAEITGRAPAGGAAGTALPVRSGSAPRPGAHPPSRSGATPPTAGAGGPPPPGVHAAPRPAAGGAR